MALVTENLQVLATLGSALAVYIFMRVGARRDVSELESRLDTRISQVELRLGRIEEKIDTMNTRLTRLEGRFEERGYWESRDWHKTGTEDKK